MLSYFLTGSYKNEDNDFELIIRKTEPSQYRIKLQDLTSSENLDKEIMQSEFADCLAELADYMAENRIRFYGKNATSSPVDKKIDQELQHFIFNSTPDHL